MLFRREAFLQTASEIMFIHALRHESNQGSWNVLQLSLKIKFLAWQHGSETDTYFAIVGKEH